MLDAVAKSIAGYNPSLVDIWGRLANLHCLEGGGERTVWLSSLVNRSDFQEASQPYPIITALNVDPRRNISGCNYGDLSSTQYEFHPFEFGTWDLGTRSFSQTAFMGSQSTASFAPSSATCINGFDSLGFVMGASSNPFNLFCGVVPNSSPFSGHLGDLWNDMIDMLGAVHGVSFLDEYAVCPGPFAATTHVDSLYLIDGSQGGEEIPIWPLLPVERGVGVIVAADFSTSTPDQLPDGSSLYKTFQRAQQMGFSRMPMIPTPAEIDKLALNKQPTFFGCRSDASQALIIYIPNVPHILGSNVPWWTIQLSSELVTSILENGNLVATMKGDTQWPICIGCAVLSKASGDIALPKACEACWDRFCWKGTASGPAH
ncbi:Lysophospholipase 2 [Cyphellophora attinorum]|uniref:Lysophospholipase n=1 Tax=Cyphellophora attinorum TaxID=1664694 RepID=A0A0N1P3D1_9EURO|nr:Lysophospholipase 2 [Phialophora attinorum]KPI44967.1 Lysophospholipase 2 [Phialophora attinorum]